MPRTLKSSAALWQILAVVLGLDSVQAGETIVFKNGVVYTNDARNPRAEAVVVQDGRILYVGSDSGAARFAKPSSRSVDLHGRTVLPGLADAHVHLSGIGAREAALNLEGLNTREDFLAAVRKEAKGKKAGEWITGRGWIETFWKPPVFPTRLDLDRVAPENPVLLKRADGHASIANSAALHVAGIRKGTPNPFGGEILKDTAGLPTGMLLDSAQLLVGRHLPPTTPEEAERRILLGVARELRLGWTQVHIAGNSLEEVGILRRLYREGRIRLRIYDAVDAPGADAEKLLREGASIGEFEGRFTLRALKVHFDGALGSRGAALLEPYADASTSGFLTQKKEDLARLFSAALRRGLQVETHAIGDSANRVVLDLYEKAMQAVPPEQRKVPMPRWRIEHAQVVHPEDIPRFARLGVIPSMQPSHAISDLHFAPARLGIPRLGRAYAWRRFRENGSIIAGGSDAPVERGEPQIEFYAAVARRDLKGFQGEGWHPEQALSREEALLALTLWPAIAAFEEKDRGSLEAGKFADMTVLSADITRIPVAEIPKARCLATVIGGEVVYQAAGF